MTEGMTEGMLTIEEVCKLLRVHRNSVRRWSNDGGLKAYRVGLRGDRRFRPEDIKIFLGLNIDNSSLREEEIFTVREVAEMLHVSIGTVRNWGDEGRLKTYRIGEKRIRRFRQKDIDSFIKNRDRQ